MLHEEIQDWLVEVLKDAGGSVPVADVFEPGKEHKYSEAQIRTASHAIGIKKPRKEGFNPGRRVYDLPSKMLAEDVGAKIFESSHLRRQEYKITTRRYEDFAYRHLRVIYEEETILRQIQADGKEVTKHEVRAR